MHERCTTVLLTRIIEDDVKKKGENDGTNPERQRVVAAAEDNDPHPRAAAAVAAVMELSLIHI